VGRPEISDHHRPVDLPGRRRHSAARLLEVLDESAAAGAKGPDFSKIPC
jgi:hypothetical protein